MAFPAIGPLISSLLGTGGGAAAAGSVGGATAGTAGGTAAGAAASGAGAAGVAQTIIGAGGGGAAGNAFSPQNMGNFHHALLNSIQGLESFYDKLELAESAMTRFSGKTVDILKSPASTIFGTLEASIDQTISGKGLPTAGVQRGVDAAWNVTGMAFIESIPIIGILPGAFKDLLDATINLPNAIEQWGEALLNSRFKLARWNNQIAATQVEAQRREILRDVASGRATAGTTEDLNDALQDLKDTFRPINDAVTNGLNRVVTGLIRITDAVVGVHTEAMKGVALLAEYIPFGKQILASLKPKDSNDAGIALTEFMRKTMDKPKNPPPPQNPI